MKIYIYPTDTVWAIGASVYDADANFQIAKIKGTEINKPLSILVGNFTQFLNYFLTPLNIDHKILQSMFQLNSTLGIPVQWLKKEIPAQIYGRGSWIGVRCLDYTLIKKLIEEIGAPVTTTSLNFNGEMPIADEDKALAFSKRITNCKFFSLDTRGPTPEGVSSSVLVLSNRGGTKILRSGKFIQELLELAEKLHTT